MDKLLPYDWQNLDRGGALAHMTEFECEVAAGGAKAIAGVDEAGRGPLAGPIVAAAVILGEPVPSVDDSKRLDERSRESLFAVLHAGPHAIGVQIVEADFIDAHGIQCANYMAMAEAIGRLDPPADFALVDGFTIEGCPTPQLKIIKGDQRSQSIAAASIIAKVTRDRLMVALHDQYPEYGFGRHKGYGTREHLDAIEQHGPCAIHRKSFAPFTRRTQTQSLFVEEESTA